MNSRRALSLVETILAMALSTLLLAVVLSLFTIGRSLFLGALEKAEVTRMSHLLPRQMVHCLEASSARSILPGEHGFACLSAYDGLGEFRTGTDGRPDWQSQLTYFVPPATQELRFHQSHRSQEAPLVLHWQALLPKQGRLLAGGGPGRFGGNLAVRSPDGKREVFIKDWNLWVRDIESKKETQLTTDGVKDFGYATDNAGWKHSDRAIVLW